MDQRVLNLADLLVNYCIRPKSGDSVSLDGGVAALPLIEATYEGLIRKGAHPVVRMSSDRMSESFYRYGKAHHFDSLTRFQKASVDCMDAAIRIAASTNTRTLSAINPKKQARLSKSVRPLLNKRLKKPWVITLFPTHAYAQDADMSLSAFEDFVYGATFADQDNPVQHWKDLSRKQERLIKVLKGADQVHIVGQGTDLKFSVKNRIFVNSPGTHNMPSGEIFTGPVETSAEGYIAYDFPVCNGGKEIDGIRLVFKKGKVVEATATKNQDYLRAMLEMDPGAKRLGEFGIGTNFGIQKFIKSILFDEKIGGTIHLALGQSYEETGGKNKSALHWDMIKDLRKGGAVYIDGKVFQKDGKFKAKIF